MRKMTATIVSVHSGSRDDLSKPACESVEVELEGFVGDAHRSYTRETWEGDKQAQGTIRRNERQWSAVSVEELAGITQQMDLTEPLTAECLGANLLIEGIAKLSRLPKGTLLQFPSGVELQVEEYNPPCHDMGKKIAVTYKSNSGEEISSTAFSKAAKLTRGLIGVIEAAGSINAGDEITVVLYEHPAWLSN